MTAGAIFAVLWPLGRRGPRRGGSDVAVYRDQLEEIDRDRAAGRIGGPEAEAARVEVSRRLLAAADSAAPDSAISEPAAGVVWRRRAAALVALVLLPIGAIALYLALGRAASARSAAQRPGQCLLGGTLDHRNGRTGRGASGKEPRRRPRLGGAGAGLYAAWPVRRCRKGASSGAAARRQCGPGGRSRRGRTALANGVVTAEAKTAFERALTHNPARSRRGFSWALRAEQDGKLAEASGIWRNLLASAPADAGWIGLVREIAAARRPECGQCARPKLPQLKLPQPKRSRTEFR